MTERLASLCREYVYCELLLSVSVMMNVHKCTVSSNTTWEIYLWNHLEFPISPTSGWWTSMQNVQKGMWKRWLSFCNSSGKLQIVIGTTGFEMGLDCPNVRQIIFWGPLSVVYIQQKGWGGRDGLLSCALSTTQMLAIDGHQSKWWNTAIILTYAEEKSFLQILRNSVIYNGHIKPSTSVYYCNCKWEWKIKMGEVWGRGYWLCV